MKKSKILILFIIFILSVAYSSAQSLTCDYCNKKIGGKYYTVKIDGKNFNICESCFKKSKKCSFCRSPLKIYKKIDGYILCSNCYKKYMRLPLCSYCHKRIIGRGSRFKNRNVWICENCLKKLPKCELCNIPLGLKGDGEKYCKNCLKHIKNAKICFYCHKKLLGEYYKYEINGVGERYLCKNCNGRYDRCYLCGFPTKNWTIVDGEKICQNCLKTLDKCRNCGNYCLKKYNFTLSKFVYCDKCVKNYKRCSSCGAPVSNVEPLNDGRLICNDCMKNSVKNIYEVKKIFLEIKKIIESALKIKVREIKKLRFADRNQMVEISKNLKGISGNRIENYPLGLFQRRGEIYNIFVLPYLRRDILKGVIAHEFAHAYLEEYHPNNKNLEEVEGFCEWVRYKILKKYGDSAGVKSMMERKDFYGKAFRKIYNIEKQRGYRAVFEYISRFD